MKPTTLYDTDFYTWTQDQAALLRESAVAELDSGEPGRGDRELGSTGSARIASAAATLSDPSPQVALSTRQTADGAQLALHHPHPTAGNCDALGTKLLAALHRA